MQSDTPDVGGLWRINDPPRTCEPRYDPTKQPRLLAVYVHDVNVLLANQVSQPGGCFGTPSQFAQWQRFDCDAYLLKSRYAEFKMRWKDNGDAVSAFVQSTGE
jgi:hypothetical protein